MSKLQNFNGHFCESEYEYAFIAFLEKEGWQYLQGSKINRQSRMDVLYSDDLESFLSDTNPDLLPDEIHSIMALWIPFALSVQKAILQRCTRSMAGWCTAFSSRPKAACLEWYL